MTAHLAPSVCSHNLCCHAYVISTGLLTCFPFPNHIPAAKLGSTTSWLIGIAKKPLPFRSRWFSQRYAPTTTRIFITERSTYTRIHASARTARRHTTMHSFECMSIVSVVDLAPSIFAAQHLDK